MRIKILLPSELKDSAVSVSVPNPVTSSPVLLMVLIVSIGFNLLVGMQVATSIFSEQKMDDIVTQFIASDEMAGLGGLAATELAGLFQEENMNRRKRKKNGINKYSENNFSQSKEELYAYSDLPRQL